jgi:RHS repeat-associated protein
VSSADNFVPEVLNYSDMYAFGMPMPGRQYQAGPIYRYGFNGKENDNEVKGNGNSLDFGARIYDPRLGRWLSVDPLQSKYPGLSPYNYTANNPILFIDPDGREIWISHAARIDGKVVVQRVQYKNGELYTADGKKYEGSNVYLMKVQSQLNNLKESNPDVNKMVTELETSNNYHEITNSIDRVAQLTPQANTDNKEANYDISRQNMMRFKKNADGSTEEIMDNTVTYFPEPYNDNPDVEAGDKEGVLAHELKHGHDKQTGKFKQLESTTNSEGLKNSEISAVKTQNKVLKSKGKEERTKYGDKKISKEDFKKVE